jgi:hypothetical protein
LERLLREFGCVNNGVAEYSIDDAAARQRIGKLISASVEAVGGLPPLDKIK